MNTNIRNIAIVRLSALGDIVNSAVVLQFIKNFSPDVKIDWITEEVFAPLLHSHPLLHAVHTVNIKQIKKEKSFTLLKQTIHKLRSLPKYDIIIDMQGLMKSAVVARLIGKNTHGFDKFSTRESLASLFYKTSTNIAYETSVIKRNCFVVGDALGFRVSDAMLLQKEAVFPVKEDFVLPKQQKNIALVIGASWESKIYPKELLAEVCQALEAQFYIIWGNAQEKDVALWLTQECTNATLAPKLDLQALASFIAHMDLVIGNDTGPTHLAWAQNIASITLFGPTNERMIFETSKNVALHSPSVVDILKINKNDFSISEIPPKKIISRVKELLYGI